MTHLHHLSESTSILDEYMAELRGVSTQGNRELFKENIRKVGRIIGYEVSKHLSFVDRDIQTPLAVKRQPRLNDDVVVVTILRAGLPLHDGLLSCFSNAENGFVAAYRKHKEDGSFHIEVGYIACPSIEGKVLILNDPMLATGSSFETAIEVLSEYGKPSAIHICAVIASQQGVDRLKSTLPDETHLWVAAIDPELNDQKYIVPGLGDAGDLAFGKKLQA